MERRVAGSLEVSRLFEILRAAWSSFFFRGFSGESLGLLRICLGFGLIAFHCLQFESLLGLDPGGAEFHYLEPIWYFSLLGIERHVPLLTFVVFGVLMLSTVTFALGLRTRTSIVLMLLAIVYLKGVRDSISGDVHHRYLIPFHILLFLLFSRAGSSCSLHNRIRARAPKLEEWEASWPIKAMQVYLCFFYFWAGVAKLRVAGLSWFTQGTHLQEDLLNRSLRYGFSAGGEPAGSWLAFRLAHEPLLCTVLSIATMAFELGFPLLLLVKKARWRLLLLAGVAAFHVTNYILLNVKFLLLPLVFLIFFDLRTVLDRIRGRFPRPKPPGGAVDPEADSGSERREMLVGAHDA